MKLWILPKFCNTNSKTIPNSRTSASNTSSRNSKPASQPSAPLFLHGSCSQRDYCGCSHSEAFCKSADGSQIPEAAGLLAADPKKAPCILMGAGWNRSPCPQGINQEDMKRKHMYLYVHITVTGVFHYGMAEMNKYYVWSLFLDEISLWSSGLELAMYTRLALNSQRPCLCTSRAGTKGVNHYIQLSFFLRC